jgi:hypothetical protein
MKKNKKVLAILLALISAPTSVMAKKAPSNCSTFGENPEITVCVEAKDKNSKLNREDYARLKSTAKALLAIQNKAQKNNKKPQAISAPIPPTESGGSSTYTPVVLPTNTYNLPIIIDEEIDIDDELNPPTVEEPSIDFGEEDINLPNVVDDYIELN